MFLRTKGHGACDPYAPKLPVAICDSKLLDQSHKRIMYIWIIDLTLEEVPSDQRHIVVYPEIQIIYCFMEVHQGFHLAFFISMPVLRPKITICAVVIAHRPNFPLE